MLYSNTKYLKSKTKIDNGTCDRQDYVRGKLIINSISLGLTKNPISRTYTNKIIENIRKWLIENHRKHKKDDMFNNGLIEIHYLIII